MKKSLKLLCVLVLFAAVWMAATWKEDRAKFILDTASTVQFNPLHYTVQIYNRSPLYKVFLSDHPEKDTGRGRYFHSAPKTSHIGRKEIGIVFYGRPTVNKEYLLNTVVGQRVDSDYGIAIKNDDGSSITVNFYSSGQPESLPKDVIKEARITYLALPEKAGEDLRLKLEILFEGGGIIRGSLTATAEDPPRIIM